jgi:hypothetical protein
MIKHVSAPLPDLCASYPHVHPAVASVVLKMMQKAPADRHQSYTELTAELHNAVAALSTPVVQHASPTPQQAVPVAPLAGAQKRTQAVRLSNADLVRQPKAKAGLGIAVALGCAAMAGGVLWLAPWRTGTKDEPASKDDWKVLFDGTDLRNWHGEQMGTLPKGWSVKNGAIHTSGKNPPLISNEEFDSFELELEWRVGPNANSGVFYWVSNAHADQLAAAPEFQVHDPAQSDRYKSGALWGIILSTKIYDNPLGQWNSGRIVARGGKVEHWVNAQLACQYNLDDPSWHQLKESLPPRKLGTWESVRKGAVALQSNGGEIDFKNVRVRPLKRSN